MKIMIEYNSVARGRTTLEDSLYQLNLRKAEVDVIHIGPTFFDREEYPDGYAYALVKTPDDASSDAGPRLRVVVDVKSNTGVDENCVNLHQVDKNEHTSGLWMTGVSGSVVSTLPHRIICTPFKDGTYGEILTESQNIANARRIVACVNACAGIKTDTLIKYWSNGGILSCADAHDKVE